MAKYDTTSLDLPTSLDELTKLPIIDNRAYQGGGAGRTLMQGPAMDIRAAQGSFEEGGLVGPQGQPIRPDTAGVQPQQPQQPQNPQMVEAQIQEFMTNNPQQVEEARAMLQQAMQEEGVTPADVNMLVQLANVAMGNPSMYPQLIRQLKQQGIAEDDMSESYDEGLLIMILIMGRLLGEEGGVQPPRQEPVMNMMHGGPLPKTGGVIPINAHAGEYVIPKHVVDKKGTDFFDKMLEAKK
tara:strand:- start:758 stop:1474 length:717 start_codon:yes stop_codon:yes gene_type:complete